ncbi:MmgE/PrpD family protein [Devosia ginsengisoli]|uniref:MmgE/PrpD family protein n=1 Tax=Devosia ginsengisoli TaxID=400770 RepID=UPI0026F06286|nr:MmgE/PrpD family protein [Devosia ginsengisoli]MCR6672613.1 MmgE/PrpD family protein [Devosia ginsengisoli]
MVTARTQQAASLPAYTEALADYAVNLTFGDLPPHVVAAAGNCLVDAVACAWFGSRFEWSQAVVSAVERPAGAVTVPGMDITTDAATAALLSGVFAHAFELDSLRKPGAGVHPGATVALPALAVAQSLGSSGRELLAAIVAGIEVMFRIGAATLHTAEKRGFHAPGITGVFGSAVAAGRLMGLSSRQMAHCLGIAASMSGGLLRFAASGDGGMVKRLHLGRAAQNGVIAARLAAAGYEGPSAVIEGPGGVLETFCETSRPELLDAGLGSRYEIETLCIKRYACHVTAQAPIQMLSDWRASSAFGPADIAGIELDVAPKLASHHAERHPADMALAQYSVPFMLAFSAYIDLDDPGSLTDAAIRAPRVHALADRIRMTADPALKGWSTRMRVTLTDGRVLVGEPAGFVGCPESPLDAAQLRRRFLSLTRAFPQLQMQALADALENIATCIDVSQLPLGLVAAEGRQP